MNGAFTPQVRHQSPLDESNERGHLRRVLQSERFAAQVGITSLLQQELMLDRQTIESPPVPTATDAKRGKGAAHVLTRKGKSAGAYVALATMLSSRLHKQPRGATSTRRADVSRDRTRIARKEFAVTAIRRRHLLASFPFLASTRAWSEDGPWPRRQITFVVPYPAGGQMDVVARLLARNIEPDLGQTVIVDNRPGANTLIATNYVAHSQADGYTFLINTSILVSNPFVLSNVKYDPLRDFIPVVRKYDWAVAWVVPSGSATTLQDFVSRAKAAKRPLTYGSPGHGSASHFYAEMFAKSAGIRLNHVPYRGEAPIHPDLHEGRLDAAMVTVGFARDHGADGAIRALAVSGRTRSNGLPGVPSFLELGIPGLAAESYTGIFAPAGTPRPVIDRLHDAVVKVNATPSFQREMIKRGLEVSPPLTQEQFAEVVRRSRDEWIAIQRQTGIKID